MILYIFVAIIMFVLLILVHELGHFIAAKSVGVRVNEFSIGMGPLIWSKQGEETLFSLRAIPMGGFCAMEGEDEASNDPRAFANQSAWKRVVILVAGAIMNFLLGLILIIIVTGMATELANPVVTGFMPAASDSYTQAGLLPGDEIIKIDGSRVLYSGNISFFMNRSSGNSVEMTIRRGGQTIILPSVPTRGYYDAELDRNRFGIDLESIEVTPVSVISQGAARSIDFVRLVWISLGDLLSGSAGVSDLSGPIGIVDMIATEASAQTTASAAIESILFFAAFIAVNLAVMNMLPIPALDGGRVFFVIVGGIYTVLTKRKMSEKIEGYVHGIGFVLLIGLMIFVAFNDVFRLVRGG